jgi:hypothetical protein
MVEFAAKIKEPLINSESFRCVGKIPGRRTGQIEA